MAPLTPEQLVMAVASLRPLEEDLSDVVLNSIFTPMARAWGVRVDETQSQFDRVMETLRPRCAVDNLLYVTLLHVRSRRSGGCRVQHRATQHVIH